MTAAYWKTWRCSAEPKMRNSGSNAGIAFQAEPDLAQTRIPDTRNTNRAAREETFDTDGLSASGTTCVSYFSKQGICTADSHERPPSAQPLRGSAP